FLQPFLDTLAVYYGAGLYLLDFMSDPEAGRLVINDWVAGQTEDRIKDLIPPPAITVNTKLVLVNAIYFNAKWKEVFNDKLTADGAFTLLDGNTVTVPMMVHENPQPYAAGSGWQAVEIPYDGDELSMVIVVPDDLTGFEDGLDAGKLAGIFSALGNDSVTLSMPRFSIEGATFSVKKVLTDLGMADAFVLGAADFSGMDGTHNLYISDVLHQAFVAVNEYGTEAAAATAVVMNDFGVPNHLDVNRPFIFFIRDLQTDTVLFIGRVLDPSA
ncbi:MAG: serpin family protein, partial [Deltaproteobacteria bacterium]